MKSLEFALHIIFYVFKNFSKDFHEYIRMDNPSYKMAWNHSKINSVVLNIIFSVLKNFSKIFCKYTRMENPSYKNKNIERKYLNNMWKSQFLKVKNSLLELQKYFIELKDREIKLKRDRRVIF